MLEIGNFSKLDSELENFSRTDFKLISDFAKVKNQYHAAQEWNFSKICISLEIISISFGIISIFFGKSFQTIEQNGKML